MLWEVQVTWHLYQVAEDWLVVKVLEVAPEISVYVDPFGEDCH